MSGIQLVLFWRDLRLDDHPAWAQACAAGPVLPVFLTQELDDLGQAQHWWLHESLQQLEQSIQSLGTRMHYLPKLEDLVALCHELSATVHVTAVVDPFGQSRLAALQQQLCAHDLGMQSYAPNLLLADQALTTGQGKPYRVFTPFWKAALQRVNLRQPLAAPQQLQSAEQAWAPQSVALRQRLLPNKDWYLGFAAHFQPGELGGQQALAQFLEQGLQHYEQGRDLPGLAGGTSALSPHLQLGELSIARVVERMLSQGYRWGFELVWLRELGWREFAHYCLQQLPDLAEQPINPKFAHFPWRHSTEDLRAWQQGQTGIPIVDAGMRQLWQTGWMHNRVRMVVGSFLVKNLRLPWQLGRAWFDDCLLDASPASNAMGWQWVAGCGVDAAPYFRIFNPVTQAQKFDAQGHYLRRYLPELASVPDAYLAAPWTAPAGVLSQAGVRLGQDYPQPIVDLKESRAAALAALASLK